MLIAAAAAVATVGVGAHASGVVGPGEVEVAASWSGRSQTHLELAPFGSIAANTHRGPLGFVVRVLEVDVGEVQDVFVDPRPDLRLEQSVHADLPALVRKLFVRALVVAAAAGAMAAALLPGRRWWSIASGGVAGVTAVGALLALTWADFDADAFSEPTFRGPLEQAPDLIATAQRYVDDFGAVRDRVAVLSAQIADLYATSITQDIAAGPGERRVLHISDLHLNPVGLEVTRELAETFDVAAILDSGDLTTFGSPLEAHFGELLEDLPVPYVLVGGNHDSNRNREALNAVDGVTVLDGDVSEVAGLNVLGVGHPSFTADNEVSEEHVEADLERQRSDTRRLVRRHRPDILLVHDPAQAELAIGEVPLVLAGHAHQRSYIEHEGTLLLTVGSTGATGLGSFTVAADLAYEAAVLYFDNDDRLVAVDNIALRGTGGDFRVDRRVVEPDKIDEVSVGPAQESATLALRSLSPAGRRDAWRPTPT